jgi:hypothetical protein
MATKQITTWDEFVASASEEITENTTYILTTDIDISSNILKSGITWRGGGTYRKTYTTAETGLTNAKKINGITYYGGGRVFSFASQYVTFQNIQFTNMQITSGYMFCTNIHNSDKRVVFNQCIFTGLVNILAYNYSTASGSSDNYYPIVFYQCAMNVKGTILHTIYIIRACCMFSECWIHFDRLGNISKYIGYGVFFSQCYLEGAVDIGSYNHLFEYLGNANIVFNMTVTTTATSGLYLFYNDGRTPYNSDASLFYGTEYSIINSSKLTQTWGDTTRLYARLTDEQMKSVNAINTAAPNFPISD